MPSFEEIGLREELLQTLEDEEIAAPTALQQAVIPTLRRGGNLVARASTGAGKTLAYALGVLDRLEPADDSAADDESSDTGRLRLVIVTSTVLEAERTGLVVTRYAEPLGFTLSVLGAGWGTPTSDAAILVAAAGDLMDAVSSSAIKLDAVEAVVIDGASDIVQLGHWEQVDAVMDLLPRDAQRVLVSAVLGEAVEDLATRRVKRALRYPSEAALPDQQEATAVIGTVGYVVTSEREKLELLAIQLRDREAGSAPPILFCRSDERAADLAERLSVRGFLIGAPDELEADAAVAAGGVGLGEIAADLDGDPGQTISVDVPADAETLRDRHQGDDDAVVLIEPRELPHLREITMQAGFRMRSAPMPSITSRSVSELKGFRDQIRDAIQQEDIAAQMLVLEPLLEEFSAVEVAAALATMARRGKAARIRTKDTPQTGKGPASSAGSPREKSDRSAPTGAAPVTWARLFVSIGSKDDVRTADLVGSLASEANIPGSRIGKIEIRDTFSIVEVQADVADQVIRAVNGTTLKGRSVRVDYDRGGPARRPDPKSGSPRRTSGRPPR